MKRRLIFLWSSVGLFVIGTAIGLVWFYGQVYDEEFGRGQRETTVANDAFVEHTARIVNQADNLLRAVRGYYLATRSVEKTQQFIASLDVDNDLFANIYMSDAEGYWVINHDAPGKHLSTRQRAQFRFHEATPDDVMYFTPTDKGAITGEYRLRITRRISLPDGEFGGMVSIHIHPAALTDYYGQLIGGRDTIATLVGTTDRRIRARYPEPDVSLYDRPIQTPLWEALENAPSGTYRSPSVVDGTVRQFIYKRVGDLPLVMVHGFSEADIQFKVTQRMHLILVAALSACTLIVLLSLILTLIVRSRAVQKIQLAQLQEANDRNFALFNSTHEAVILLDGERPVDCNPQTLTVFGARNKAEFLAQPPWSSRITPPVQADGSETEAYARRQVDAAFRHGTHRFDYLHTRLDSGEEFQVDVMLTAIHINGKPILQAVLRDMTERIRFEQKLQAANDQLTQRNHEQDQFLSMLSHELKTPLAVIRMSLGKSHEAIDDASRARLVRAVADINAIIERCLQTDRLQHGRIEANKQRYSPGDLLRQVIASSAEPQRVSLDAAPLAEGVSDSQLLSVILGNLIDNALKYSAPHALIAVTAVAAERNENAGIQVEVSNPPGAAGMPDAGQVFRKYYRAPGAHSKTGSGLGLHIAKCLASMLGGDLSYVPSAGAVKFALWIPR